MDRGGLRGEDELSSVVSQRRTLQLRLRAESLSASHCQPLVTSPLRSSTSPQSTHLSLAAHHSLNPVLSSSVYS